FPIAMTYDITGTGIQGVDYSRMKGFEIIPHGSYAQTDTFLVLADAITEPVKQNTVTLNTSSLYSTTSFPQNVTISDCTILDINENTLENENALENATFSIYPNPATEILNVSFINKVNNKQNSIQQVLIFNTIGQLVKKVELFQPQQINISDLPCGLYFVRLPNYFNKTLKFIKM
ncbi:MAG: T9SS type A sorting domain-containing protein, partial [Ignavibacteria bacterium]|nr:T9SS type A sorting domain-containing protein [Ignavibacteria bacterium]